MTWQKWLNVVLASILALSALAGCVQPPEIPPEATAVPSSTTGPTPSGAGSQSGGITGPLAARVDGYLALAPRILRANQTEQVAISLFQGNAPAVGDVKVALLKDNQRLVETSARVQGRGDVALALPKLAEGDYQLQVSGSGFNGQSPVRVEDGTLLFVETDKPIYKPGQTIHIRTITLDPRLMPVPGTVTVEVADAKGTKVFKKDVQNDDYGMSVLDMPLSTEPNLGTWKVTGRIGKRETQVDVRIERYVLPKYEVKVDLPRDWFLASDQISGTVRAEYSYGKPVQGEVVIRALRYVGNWEEFANVSKRIDGKADFQLPAVRYVSGVPGAKGMGNVQLEVTVREPATGYEEKTTSLLNIAATPLVLQVIPESVTFKPSLPLSLLVIAETPDKKPLNAEVRLDLTYTKQNFQSSRETRQVSVRQGKGMLQITPPADAISLSLGASSQGATTSLALQSGYSPSGSFIHVEQVGGDNPRPGDTVQFKVSATKEAANFYYEVVARGTVVFSAFSRTPDLAVPVTPKMAPKARLLVYQILQNSEVAADYVPFNVGGAYPQKVSVSFGAEEVEPGDEVDLRVQTEGPAKVGLAAVDRSVFILAENRLNLQQIFADLERLYQQPQVELHEVRPLDKISVRGAKDVIGDAGLVVLTNKQVPDGKEYQSPQPRVLAGARQGLAVPEAAMPMAAAAAPPMAPAAAKDAAQSGAGNLAEVQRVRQFFPETWVWSTLQTDAKGEATQRLTAPDSITTWMLRAVALSKQTGLGIAEAQLRVLQPFFVQIDLPYSAIRGEEFPVKVALYNYRPTAEQFQVDIEGADWFALRDQRSKSVQVAPNEVAGVSFTIRPTKLGKQAVKITARSGGAADAVVKDLLIEPEGVAREEVDNIILSAGGSRDVAQAIPMDIIEGSARAYLAVTGSYLTQSIEGLEKLLQMPFGCGEQNMILMAPNVFITRYLKQTNQIKPEIMAKAENLTITGYQRQLTYRRRDASFSAFGEQDKEGSLWLTAFVLKTFAQAKEMIYVDDAVLQSAAAWIVKQQRADGSFDPIGFVAHQEMMGGLSGKTALTAYVAIALWEAGEKVAAGKAVQYLEGALNNVEDPYGLALGSYALALAKSPRAKAVIDRLLAKAKNADGGLYWDSGAVEPMPMPAQPGAAARAPIAPPNRRPNRSTSIEATAYATLALIEQGDRLNAGRASRWLVSQRNAYGGFGSTQDTVVGLQALTRYAADAKADVDATLTLRAGAWEKVVRVTPENADVLQVVDIPVGVPLNAAAVGKGQLVLQAVRRYNVPDPEMKAISAFQIDVKYGAGQIEVDDTIAVNVSVQFMPPEPMQAGMVVLDIAVPTGFAAVTESLDALKKAPKVKRYDLAGRKVIIYIEDMLPNERLDFAFQAKALFPVKAQAVTSQAYAYYRPEWRGESLGGALNVAGN